MSKKAYSIVEVKEQVAQLLKSRVEKYSEELRMLTEMELQKAEACPKCGGTHASDLDKCGDMLPTKKDEIKASKDVTPKKSGHGALPRRINKSQPPMAKPPTKAGSAVAPTSKVGSPAVGAPPKSDVAKGEEELEKARRGRKRPTAWQRKQMKLASRKKTLTPHVSPAPAGHMWFMGKLVSTSSVDQHKAASKAPEPAAAPKEGQITKSEQVVNNIMGNCALCGKSEHPGNC